MIKIINAQEKDLDEILKIYSYARNFMRETGNPTQWSEDYPSRELLTSDIKNNQLYIGIDENNTINCVFAFIIGPDKCYARIDNGAWLNDEIYGTIHCIASNGQTKDIFKTCLKFCKSQITNIRIDTHHNNKIMQHLIEKNGFTKCGIVYMADNTPRIAYQSNRPY